MVANYPPIGTTAVISDRETIPARGSIGKVPTVKGSTLTVDHAYPRDWGRTNDVIAEGGQIIWLKPGATALMIQ